MHTEKWLNKLERKFGRHAVPGVMNILITGMIIVFIMDSIICPATGKMPLSPLIHFSRQHILQGQVWRLISFVFAPISTSPLFMIFTLYFYWMIGQVLESQWGTFRFNIYLLCSWLGAVLSGFISGYTGNVYMTLTMFLAFAIIAPNYQILLFFFIPIKIRYLAYLDAVLITYRFIFSDWSGKTAIILSLINFFIFFGEGFVQFMKMRIHHWKYKIKNKR